MGFASAWHSQYYDRMLQMLHPNLIITPEAQHRIEEALAENQSPFFRVFIQGGGCSGYSYQFDIDHEQHPDDFALEWERGALLVDASSASYLDGATLDFSDELWSRQFVMNNPNAKQTCGCGASFSV